MNPGFLVALMAHTGLRMNTIDLLTVADALPGPPPVELREIDDPDHPRGARALKFRDEVRVWAADGGVLILGRGVAGRWEAAIEVDEEVRHRGLGRALATAARHLTPGEVVWSQQSPRQRPQRADLPGGGVPAGGVGGPAGRPLSHRPDGAYRKMPVWPSEYRPGWG